MKYLKVLDQLSKIILSTFSYLEHHIPNHVLREELVPMVIPLLHQLVQVLLHVLKHKVEGVIFSDDLKRKENKKMANNSDLILGMNYELAAKGINNGFVEL